MDVVNLYGVAKLNKVLLLSGVHGFILERIMYYKQHRLSLYIFEIKSFLSSCPTQKVKFLRQQIIFSSPRYIISKIWTISLRILNDMYIVWSQIVTVRKMLTHGASWLNITIHGRFASFLFCSDNYGYYNQF